MLPASTASEPSTEVNGRLVVVGGILVALIMVGYFALGMPGMNHGDSQVMPGMNHVNTNFMRVDSATFEKLLARPGTVGVNVHEPYTREIPGTARFIPLDKIARDPDLPDDKSISILVYCETGAMSAVAAAALADLGYTNVTELTGGMQAWQASGRTLVVR